MALSKHSIGSKWVENEINMAFVKELEGKKIFLLPLLLDNSEIPLSIRDKFFADFRYEYNDGLSSVLSKINFNQDKDRYEYRQLKRYCKKVDEQLPLFANLLRLSIRSGLPFLQILEMLSNEMTSPMKELINEVRSEIELNKMTLGESLTNILERVPTKRMQWFKMACSIGETGGILDEALEQIEFDRYEPGTFL